MSRPSLCNMETDNTIINAKRCPTCGYRGEADICPFDGTGMVDNMGVLSMDSTPKPIRNRKAPEQNQDDNDGQSLSSIDQVAPSHSAIEHRQTKPLSGTILGGRYVLNDVIGRGGMGTVYSANQPSVDRTVAIKVLNQEFAENAMVVRRFHQEAQAASKLTHPNTISVYDFGETDGSLYIVMEHLVGETLKSLLQRKGRLPLHRACLIIKQVLKSIAEAHDAGVIHRDLKPDNIFITPINDGSDFVKVLDFGVAKLRKTDDSDTTLTQMGAVFGTPKDMAPEQTQNISLDGRSDLYSVGIIFYELLLGNVPFDGENPLAILMDHANQQPASFNDVDPSHGHHPAVQSVVMKALEKNRNERYLTAQEFLIDIDIIERYARQNQTDVDKDEIIQLIRIKDRNTSSELDLSAELPAKTTSRPKEKSSAVIVSIIAASFMLAGLTAYLMQDKDVKLQTPSSLPVGGIISGTSDPIKTKQTKQTKKVNEKSSSKAASNSRDDERLIPFSLKTTPPGATLVDLKTGRHLGRTPKTVRISEMVVIEARLDGYKSERIAINPDDSDRQFTRTLTAIRLKNQRKRLVKRRTQRQTSKSKPTPRIQRMTRQMGSKSEENDRVIRTRKNPVDRHDDDIKFELQ